MEIIASNILRNTVILNHPFNCVYRYSVTTEYLYTTHAVSETHSRRIILYRFILSFLSILFFITSFCDANELTADTLIRGVNQARLTIESGEVYTHTTKEYTASKTDAEIDAWIEMKRERELKKIGQGVRLNNNKSDYLNKKVQASAQKFIKRTEHKHTITLFNVLEQNSISRPRLYQYKLTNIDTPRYPLDKMSDRFRPSDRLHLVVYDLENQVHESIGDIIFYSSHAHFSKSGVYIGHLHHSVWGRSHFHVPSDAKLLGKETIDNVECQGLAFIASDKRKVHIWIDPTKDFSVKRIDYYRLTDETKIPYTRIVYKNFKKYGDIWFPIVVEDTAYRTDGKMAIRATTKVIAVELNVDFPKDFFHIKNEFYKSIATGQIDQDIVNTSSATNSDPSLLLCGPKSLLHICGLLKVDTNLSELKKMSGFTSEGGTTMLGLREAATYKGLAPVGVKASVRLLKRKKVPLPAIAYVNNNHFIVLESVNSDGVNITDAVQKYGQHVKWDELSNIWEGDLLIFNKKKMPRKKTQVNVPLAFSEKPIYNFAKALGGSKIEHTFTIKNIGKKPLEILSVTETCVCTATVLSQDEILPGKTGSISSVLTVPTGNGQLNESLHVLTNDPIQNTLTLTIKGEAFTPLKTFPELIAFGNQKPLKNPLTKQISLHLQEGTEIHSVKTNSKDIKTSLKIRDNIPYVDIQYLSTLPVGKFSHSILVDYIYKGKRGTHKISTFGEIIGELRVVPNRLFLGLIKDPTSFSKTLMISSLNTEPFQVTAVKTKTKAINFTFKSNEKKTDYKLTATISSEAKPGEISGDIVIHTSSSVQPTVRVPFFGIIAGSK